MLPKHASAHSLDNTMVLLLQVRGHFRPEFINRIDEFIVFQVRLVPETAACVTSKAVLHFIQMFRMPHTALCTHLCGTTIRM